MPSRSNLRFVALSLVLFCACAEPAPSPVSPAPATAAAEPPATQAPPATAPPTAAPSDDPALPVITAGLPTIVAEAPVVSPEAARAAGTRPEKPAPVPSRAGIAPPGPGRSAEATAQGVIRSHFSDIEACYGPVAQKDPTIAGRIVVQWTLGADGTPTGVAIVNDTLRAPAVTECIRARARTWRFPPPGTGVSVVRYPFDLRVQ
jgi:hypothetical protein